MVRRYDDEVQVRPALGESEGEPEPDAFVWRGRLYVVRAVLARWHERRAWWRDPAAAALLGLQADAVPAAAADAWLADVGTAGSSGAGGTTTGTTPAAGMSAAGTSTAWGGASASALAGECQVWRVEAAAGRSSPLGVYDLVHTPGVPSTWHLARVAD